MTVQIKPLLGYVNPINDENNTLSLLIKSNWPLREHLSNAIEKILASLTCIIRKYESKYKLYFYHKIKISCNRDPEYHRTKSYEMHSQTIEKELSNSIKETLKKDFGKLLSHFINITISLNDELLVISKDSFSKLNWSIRNELAKINNKDPQPFNNEVKDIKEKPLDSLFIDDNEVKDIKEKPLDSLFIDDNEVKDIKEKPLDSLFIDEYDEDHFKKNRKVSTFIDDNRHDPFEKRINEAKEMVLKIKRTMMKTNRIFISILEYYYEYLIS